MLIRLLIAVLTLVGPIPLRVCTCAAGHTAHTTNAENSQAAISADEHNCCSHHATPSDVPASDNLPSHVAGAEREATHPAQHDRDCPAANQQLVIREAVAPLSPAPTEYGPAHVLGWATPPLDFRISARSSATWPIAMKNPLYLTFLTLRN